MGQVLSACRDAIDDDQAAGELVAALGAQLLAQLAVGQDPVPRVAGLLGGTRAQHRAHAAAAAADAPATTLLTWMREHAAAAITQLSVAARGEPAVDWDAVSRGVVRLAPPVQACKPGLGPAIPYWPVLAGQAGARGASSTPQAPAAAGGSSAQPAEQPTSVWLLQLARRLQTEMPGLTAVGGAEQLAENIVSVLTPRDEGAQQSGLFDLLGEAALTYMPDLLAQRDVLVHVTPSDLRRAGQVQTLAHDTAAQLAAAAGAGTGSAYQTSVSVSSSQQKRAAKRADKLAKRAARAVARGDDATLLAMGLDPRVAASHAGASGARAAVAQAAAAALQGGVAATPGQSAAERRAAVQEQLAELRGGGELGSTLAALKRSLPTGAEEVSGDGWKEIVVPAPRKDATPESACVPVSSLPDFAQTAFAGVERLNPLQSAVFDCAWNSNENMLIAAPTGAGKTNCAMLTVAREIGQNIEGGVLDKRAFKIVYVAPMKALAAEVTEKFSKRLSALGMSVRECTGDMQLSRAEIERTQMLVVTPEKWDIMTRRAGEGSLMGLVRLLIFDEVHLLAESRGSVIESIVARTLRYMEASQTAVRIVALSATLPNYKDVAAFLRVNPATGLHHFSGAHRPVPLEQRFIGVNEHNVFKRKARMDAIAWERTLAAIREGKQVMVFVHSRKDTAKTARALLEMAAQEGAATLLSPYKFTPEVAATAAAAEGIELADEPDGDPLGELMTTSAGLAGVKQPSLAALQAAGATMPASYRTLSMAVAKSRNHDVKDLFLCGFGIHHAGMLRSDRTLSERLFAAGAIKVLCCTATLAWGVNLPAHTVIIKGTQLYNAEAGGFTDVGVLDVQQIFGRAGRPQFDTSGRGIIITSQDKLPLYLGMLTSAVPIESRLHAALPDNLNAEIVSATVTNVREAVSWLTYTYMYVRMLRNPLSYGIDYAVRARDPVLHTHCAKLIHDAAKRLDAARMVRYDPDTGALGVTDLGRVGSHYYIGVATIELLNERLGLADAAGTAATPPILQDAELIELVCMAKEFEAVKARDEELRELDALRQQVPLPIKGDVSATPGKVNVLLQAYISGCGIRAFTLVSDTAYCVQSASRIARGLFELALKRGWAALAAGLLDVCKSLATRIWWWQHPLTQIAVLHQQGGVPLSIIRKLEDMEWTGALENLRDMSAADLSSMLRLPDIGHKIASAVASVPALSMQASVQPITAGIVRLTLTVTPNFTWVPRLHGATQRWWLWVEDDTGGTIYHHEAWVATKDSVGCPAQVTFIVPLATPTPGQLWVRACHDTWVGVGDTVEISLHDILLPADAPAHTPLLDLAPLATTALRDPQLQALYPYSHFNPVQTQVFHMMYHTDHSVLIGAPTGSGKTLVAELALYRLWAAHPHAKAVYIGPLKALVSERVKDWRQKFAGLGKVLAEVTGDVTPDMRTLQAADILVTTPEKWDAMSRKWRSRPYIQRVQLLILDEVHLLGEERGPVLEVLVSRARFMAAARAASVRFVALSTALANARDLADWLGVGKVGLYNFSPSVRPVPTSVHIQGFPGRHYCPRMASMNKPAYAVIQTHSPDQPVLIFVASRRQTRLTAQDLISLAAADGNARRFCGADEASLDRAVSQVKDPAVAHALAFGVGLHHAGLNESDRSIVESLFAACQIQVLVATATLAWGVNLPAHCVIVKGTEFFDAKQCKYVDYPITDVLQMIGRAGRPQFDTHGVAAVLVHEPKKTFYRKFLYEPFPVESQLIAQLPEHLNAEIAGGTITSLVDAVEYMTWTFLFRRLVKNPSFYGCEAANATEVLAFLRTLVSGTLQKLAAAGCVALEEGSDADSNPTVRTTAAGQITSTYYLSHRTTSMLRAAFAEPGFAADDSLESARAVWKLLCNVPEFEEVPVRHSEDETNAQLATIVPWSAWVRRHGGPMGSAHTKALLMMLAHCGRVPMPILDYVNDTKAVLDQMPRIIHAAVDVAAEDGALHASQHMMHVAQALVHGVIPGGSPFFQLPGLALEHCNALEAASGASAGAGSEAGQTAFAWFLQQSKQRQVQLLTSAGVSQDTAARAAKVASSFPRLQVEVHGADGWQMPSKSAKPVSLPSGHDGLLEFKLSIENAATAQARISAHKPGKPRQLGWWAVAASAGGDAWGSKPRLLAVKRVSGDALHQKGRVQQLRLPAVEPDVHGKYPKQVQLLLVPDALIGCDMQVCLRVTQAAAPAPQGVGTSMSWAGKTDSDWWEAVLRRSSAASWAAVQLSSAE